ncbi:hypothetical protein XENOCAPTIV_004054 [Xenoophorus captivus]|uniref:Uncharacterized protein n=1 Tax=Xenoophorus captivus TaxID=1517983 RepID=A0ABV0RP54_9TELE
MLLYTAYCAEAQSTVFYSRSEALLYFVCSMCMISHCGCNLSPRFLIHSLYLPKNNAAENLTVHRHVTPPHLVIPPPRSHVPHSPILYPSFPSSPPLLSTSFACLWVQTLPYPERNPVFLLSVFYSCIRSGSNLPLKKQTLGFVIDEVSVLPPC